MYGDVHVPSVPKVQTFQKFKRSKSSNVHKGSKFKSSRQRHYPGAHGACWLAQLPRERPFQPLCRCPPCRASASVVAGACHVPLPSVPVPVVLRGLLFVAIIVGKGSGDPVQVVGAQSSGLKAAHSRSLVGESRLPSIGVCLSGWCSCRAVACREF